MNTRTTAAAGICLAMLTFAAARAADDPGDRAALMRAHRGGTLRLTATQAAGSLDPQVSDAPEYWQLYAFLYDGLVTFKKVGGAASTALVADLAEALPSLGDEGRTYRFKLRQGIRFSDGGELTGQDVVASLVRLFRVNGSLARRWFGGIVGADDCLKEAARCTLDAGVVADETAHTVTIHLTAADGEFLDKLATPFGTILPAGTAGRDAGSRPWPGTGAYRVGSYDPNRELTMERNPHFVEFDAEAMPDGYPDQIALSFGLPDEAEVTAVLNGQFDWMYDDMPLDRLGEVLGRHKDLAHVHPLLGTYYLSLNTRLPPFDQATARQAVAYAVDRNEVVKLYGGAALGAPLCQQLPVGMPGYVAYCPFTKNPGGPWTAPDLGKARQLVQESGTAGQTVTLVSSDKVAERSIGEYLAGVLRGLGYDARLKVIGADAQPGYIQNADNKVQASLTNWFQDYPAPSNFLYALFRCDHEPADGSLNLAGFCDDAIDAAMKAALADPQATPGPWSDIDRRVTDAAPAVSLFQPKRIDLVSPRVGHYLWSDQVHMLFSQAWVK